MESNQERKWIVYKHTNKINGKVYVGQTCNNINKRWRNGEGYKNCTLFYRAIQKYGWDNFEHEIIKSNLSQTEANELESFYIFLYKSTDKNYGYNVRTGGENSLLSEETKDKIRKANTGRKHNSVTKKKLSELNKGENNPNWNKPRPESVRRKISKSNKGRIFSENHKEKLSENHASVDGEKNPFWGRQHSEQTKKLLSQKLSGENHPMYGKHPSQETKDKIGKAHKGMHHTEETKKKLGRPVMCVETGEIFYSAVEAGKAVGVSGTCITSCCTGKQKTSGGYHWIYKKEENEEINETQT